MKLNVWNSCKSQGLLHVACNTGYLRVVLGPLVRRGGYLRVVVLHLFCSITLSSLLFVVLLLSAQQVSGTQAAACL